MNQPRRRHAFLVLTAALSATLVATLALSGGCGLAVSGISSGIDGGACVSAAQCDDKNPCTADTCSADDECVHTVEPDGPAPAAEQPQGTCTKIMCSGGVAATVADTSNVPKPPNGCTKASCDGATPVDTFLPDGMSCVLAGTPGQCKAGACTVSCKTVSECPSMGACQPVSCNGATGTCEYTEVPDGTPTPGVTQKAGNCHTRVCLMGEDTNAVDDGNVPAVPATMAGCEDASCSNGSQVFTPHATGSPCSAYMGDKSGFCDAKPSCVQCTQDSECAGTGPTNDCQHPACTGNACAPAYTAQGTATTSNPPQVVGDCQTIVCDGSGGTTMVTDSSDVPNDSTGCSVGSCNGGTPTQTQAPDGTACGKGQTCTGGTCSCNNDGDCTAAVGPNAKCTGGSCTCTKSTCGTTSPATTCGTVSDGCGGMIDCDDKTEDGGETDVDCGGPTNACATRCAQGEKCDATSDCVSGLFCVDGFCCNSACDGACEACSAAKQGQGTNGVCGAVATGMPDPRGICTSQAASTCGQEGTCDGSGMCTTWPSGTVCQAASCGKYGLNLPETCVGGKCTQPNPGTQGCGAYPCTGNACATSCGSTAGQNGCAGGYYCDGVGSGTCRALVHKFGACTANYQCYSNDCVGMTANHAGACG